MLIDCLGLEGSDDSGPRARRCLLLLPLPEHCTKATHLVPIQFDLNTVQLLLPQSQPCSHFSPQGGNFSGHLVPEIKVTGLIIQPSILTWVCSKKILTEYLINWHSLLQTH